MEIDKLRGITGNLCYKLVLYFLYINERRDMLWYKVEIKSIFSIVGEFNINCEYLKIIYDWFVFWKKLNKFRFLNFIIY